MHAFRLPRHVEGSRPTAVQKAHFPSRAWSAALTVAGLGWPGLSCAPRSTPPAQSAPPAPPTMAWLDRTLSPDERADRLVQAMTQDEKLTVVTGYFGVQKDWNQYRFPEARTQSAGVVRG